MEEQKRQREMQERMHRERVQREEAERNRQERERQNTVVGMWNKGQDCQSLYKYLVDVWNVQGLEFVALARSRFGNPPMLLHFSDNHRAEQFLRNDMIQESMSDNCREYRVRYWLPNRNDSQKRDRRGQFIYSDSQVRSGQGRRNFGNQLRGGYQYQSEQGQVQNIELAKRRRRNSPDRNRMNAGSGYYRQDDMNVQSYETNNGPRNQPWNNDSMRHRQL
jgi:hypothetical protein